MKKLSIILSTILILFSLTSCSTKLDYSEVDNYADNITKELLISINNLSYDDFASYLSDDMKESYTLGTFQTESAEILNEFGSFKSLSFYAGEKRNGYIYIIYDVSYSNLENPISISITFKENDDSHKVYELYFDK
ncbi:DUF3887 domain-containing protein [uncultured Clostridium sp.]|uniref:DUF3887 domain-containing protein n=1 Tax=uncultured Clostridium sp. TaxID=59620 RepID=UPI0025EE8C75|nr:DUF3887 domain-containing protein [uncultured Clostridium sp.]